MMVHRWSTQSTLQVSMRKCLEKLPSKRKEKLGIQQWMQMDGEGFYVQVAFATKI